MKFKFNISYLNNLYFFIANLTEFHYSCRTEFNSHWLNSTGPLKTEEQKILQKLKPVFKKYGFENNKKGVHLGQPFFNARENNKLPAIKEYLSDSEFNLFRQGVDIFTPRFEKIYQPTKLEQWQSKLEHEVEQDRFVNVFKTTRKFFKPTGRKKTLRIELLTSPTKTGLATGGANLGPEAITLEVPTSKPKDWQVEFASNILLHELAHLWLEASPVNNLVTEILTKNDGVKNSDRVTFTKEMIIESLAPLGYPCQLYSQKVQPAQEFLLHNLSASRYTYFLNKKQSDLYCSYKSQPYLIWLSYPLVAQYVDGDQKIDKQFVLNLIDLIKKGRSI